MVWLLGTWGFSAYAANFGSYNVTYGSIGAVIVMLTWFYITGFIFLMGGEMNAIIESASPEGKDSGARAPGEAAAAPEERRAPIPVGAAKRGARRPDRTAASRREPQREHRSGSAAASRAGPGGW